MTTYKDLPVLAPLADWPGGISAAKLIALRGLSESVLDAAAQSLEECFRPAASSVQSRCIDGRSEPGSSAATLGPQVPGGTPGAALAYRLSVIEPNVPSRVTLAGDTHHVLQAMLSTGKIPGGHRDTLGNGIGCGAIDRMDNALEVLAKPEVLHEIEALTRSVLDDRFDLHAFQVTGAAAKTLAAHAEAYLAQKQRSIEAVEQALGRPVPVLLGEHAELFVIMNYVPNSTFSTTEFNAANTGVQAFNYDVWRSFEEAEDLFPAPNDQSLRNRFIHARVMIAVATLMVLTDGSQRLVVRSQA